MFIILILSDPTADTFEQEVVDAGDDAGDDDNQDSSDLMRDIGTTGIT